VLGALRPQRPLTFNVGDLKLRDLAKLWIFKLIMMKSNFKKISYDVIFVTSSSLFHRKTSSKLRYKMFSILGPSSIKISGNASVRV